MCIHSKTTIENGLEGKIMCNVLVLKNNYSELSITHLIRYTPSVLY